MLAAQTIPAAAELPLLSNTKLMGTEVAVDCAQGGQHILLEYPKTFPRLMSQLCRHSWDDYILTTA